jgi:hypothetical protein
MKVAQIMKPPRYATIPVFLTMLTLVGVTLSMTSFQKRNIRFKILKPAAAEGLPVVCRGEVLDVEGTADAGGNPYRRITLVIVKLMTVAEAPKVYDRNVHVTSDQASYDRASKRFSARPALGIDAAQNEVYLAVEVEDVLGRRYGPDQRPLAGNAVSVRVE